jgi:hypothetical protein
MDARAALWYKRAADWSSCPHTHLPQSASGWRIRFLAGPFSLKRALASIYLETDVLDHDQKAGCVEQPRHIRLSLNGAGNFGPTTCFFHIRYQPGWSALDDDVAVPRAQLDVG